MHPAPRRPAAVCAALLVAAAVTTSPVAQTSGRVDSLQRIDITEDMAGSATSLGSAADPDTGDVLVTWINNKFPAGLYGRLLRRNNNGSYTAGPIQLISGKGKFASGNHTIWNSAKKEFAVAFVQDGDAVVRAFSAKKGKPRGKVRVMAPGSLAARIAMEPTKGKSLIGVATEAAFGRGRAGCSGTKTPLKKSLKPKASEPVDYSKLCGDEDVEVVPILSVPLDKNNCLQIVHVSGGTNSGSHIVRITKQGKGWVVAESTPSPTQAGVLKATANVIDINGKPLISMSVEDTAGGTYRLTSIDGSTEVSSTQYKSPTDAFILFFARPALRIRAGDDVLVYSPEGSGEVVAEPTDENFENAGKATTLFDAPNITAATGTELGDQASGPNIITVWRALGADGAFADFSRIE